MPTLIAGSDNGSDNGSVRGAKPIISLMSLIALASASLPYPVAAKPSAGLQSTKPACAMRASDRGWLDRSVAAWRHAARTYGRFATPAHARAIIGSAECVLVSDSALFLDRPATWTAARGHGNIPVIEDFALPLSPISQAMTVNGNPYFIMSAPSVWREAKITGGQLGIERLMTAVFIHETSHILQQKTYFPMVEKLVAAHDLPKSFNDDSIQDRFKSDPIYSESVKRETDLLFRAADARTPAEARRLAQQALVLIKARRAHFYANEQYLGQLEDVFLTLEGSGQWLGYHWLIDTHGGRASEIAARTRFGKGGGFWSQEQGLALFMVVDRLDGGAWKSAAFGGGGKAGIAFLETALDTSGSTDH